MHRRGSVLVTLLIELFLGTSTPAEEQHSVMTALQSTTLSGYVDTSVNWWAGSRNGSQLPGLTYASENELFFALQISERLNYSSPISSSRNYGAVYGGPTGPQPPLPPIPSAQSTIPVQTIPEPKTITLLLTATIAAFVLKRRRLRS